MGKINISIDDNLERRFREEIFKRLGMKKGNIQHAIEEAMEIWIRSKEVVNEKRKQ
jgi:hypothetical protein